MKRGWKTSSLGGVCHVTGGGTPSKDHAEYFTGTVPWATVRDMRSEMIFETEYKITEEAVEHSATNIIPTGNVVIATRVGLGKVCMLGQDTAINQDLRGIIPNDPQTLSVRFLFLWLKSIAHLILAEGTGATVQGVRLPFIKSLQVPLPPLPEQRRIVGILDEAFEAIAIAKANAEKNLQYARALFESHLQAIFTQRDKGWVQSLFSDVCQISSTLVDPRLPEYQELPHVGGANIETKTGGVIDLKTAREEGLKSGKFRFDETMVLYSKIRPYLRKVARPDFKGLCSADIYPLSVKKDQMSRDFLFYLLLSPEFTEYAITGSARAGMPKVNRNHLFAFRCYLPPLVIQKRYAEQLDFLREETQRLESIYQQKLAALEELKKSLLHYAFSGEL